MNKNEAFELLWTRTRERGEFPALQRALSAIVATMHDDMASGSELAATVLGDFTLTQKVLRLANSAMYAPYGRDVTTVSRALMILGSGTVAHLAMGIQLLETFEGLAGTQAEAAGELAQASLAGKLAREFATLSGAKFGEEAAVATLMFQLARLLVVFYLPEQWQAIRALLDQGESEDAAFFQVLGVTPDEISDEAVREWELPHQVIHKASAQPGETGSVASTHEDWLACVAGLSTALAQAFSHDADGTRVKELLEAYGPTLGLAADRLEETAKEMFAAERKPQEVLESRADKPQRLEGKPLDSEKRLERALAEVMSAAGEADVSTLTQMVLESMMQGLGLVSCAAFFCIRKKFEARFGFGPGIKDKLDRMVFEEAFVPDVFHLALSQGRSIYLPDVQDAKIAARVPQWHRTVFPDVTSVMILPIRLKDRSIGFLYGNWGPQACSAGVTARELEYLNAMRNQVMKAFEDVGRQSDRVALSTVKAA